MAILTSLEVIDKIYKHNIEIFDDFEAVYVFGSILDVQKSPNDLDLLLVYSNYSDDSLRKMKLIRRMFETQIGLLVDLTVLSEREKQETNFLERLNSKYVKLK